MPEILEETVGRQESIRAVRLGKDVPPDANLHLKHKEGCCKHVANDIAPTPPVLPEQMDLGAEDIDIGVGESKSLETDWKRTEFLGDMPIHPQGREKTVPYRLERCLQLVWVVGSSNRSVYQLWVKLVSSPHPGVARWWIPCLKSACIFQAGLMEVTNMVREIPHQTYVHTKFLLRFIDRM